MTAILKTPRMVRGVLRGGEARFMLCETTRMVQQARDIHHASNTCTAAMGRLISGAAMMGAGLKNDGDRLSIIINGGGPLGALCAVAASGGRVKVTVDHPQIELPLRKDGKIDVGGAVGKDGQISVMRSYGFGEPYMGRVNLSSGEIAEDFALYYLESEQIPSLCALGVHISDRVESAGGILIQAMPNCTESLLNDLEIRTELFAGISQLLQEYTLEELIEACFRGLEPEILEQGELELRCDCSMAYIEKVLLSMGRAELTRIMEEEDACEVQCHFCGKHYAFDRNHLNSLIQDGQMEETL